ncbi:MAG: helix-turn-helix domain-containing protein [Eubacterium sp.]|nr:helix-turn-helix domain-containing protein [Eubacterium sp.]
MNKEVIQYNNINGVSITDDESPTSFPSHWHSDGEITIILKDGCKYKVGDEVIKPEKGDIVIVWPRELHEIINVPENGSMFIQFSSGVIENNIDLITASRFFKRYHHISAKKEPELAGAITEIIYKIRDIFRTSPSFSETRCKRLIFDIMVQLGDLVLREQKEQIGNDKFNARSWEYIKQALKLIAERHTDNISQAEVASNIGLNPYYFSKLFNEYTEMSFPAYLSSVRVQSAINLLTDERLSITDCAFMSGFQSTTTFNKVFHEVTGCTPREYRKLHHTQ